MLGCPAGQARIVGLAGKPVSASRAGAPCQVCAWSLRGGIGMKFQVVLTSEELHLVLGALHARVDKAIDAGERFKDFTELAGKLANAELVFEEEES